MERKRIVQALRRLGVHVSIRKNDTVEVRRPYVNHDGYYAVNLADDVRKIFPNIVDVKYGDRVYFYPEKECYLYVRFRFQHLCDACSDVMVEMQQNEIGKLRRCVGCGGIEIAETSPIATSWCKCSDQMNVVYYQRQGGGHGWFHIECNGLVQSG